MDEQVTISIFDVVGSGHCTASEDGQKVYELIRPMLTKGAKIIVSFKNVEDLTSAFLNAAIGQLYGEFAEDDIKARVTVSDASQDDLIILKRVVDRAKDFFKNPERYEEATSKTLDKDNEE